MATPSPISEIRNCTTKLTSLKVVNPSTSRKVVRIETAAISSGSRARNDANTNSSTSSAPAAPSRVSASTLGPSVSPPADNSPYDVSPPSSPAWSAAWARAGSSCASMPGPKDVGGGPWMREYAVSPSGAMNASSPVVA